jgi:hypothetical protein
MDYRIISLENHISRARGVIILLINDETPETQQIIIRMELEIDNLEKDIELLKQVFPK